jgi:probable DNA repair protein
MHNTLDNPLVLATGEPIARALRAQHALAQRRAGLHAWEMPAIHSLHGWCKQQWLATWPAQQVLHGVQELVLWQHAIERDHSAAAVVGKSALARLARGCARLAVQYRIDVGKAAQYTDEQRAFARWHRQVSDTLRASGWVTETEIPALAVAGLRDGTIRAPRSVVVRGAARTLTPLDQFVLDTLAGCGSQVTIEPAPDARATLHATRYADDDEALRALALQLRDRLLPFIESDEAPPALLVLCPDAAAARERIESVFKPILAPWLLLPDEGLRPVPWRFARGRPLDQHPLVAAALAACGLNAGENTPEEISRLLLSSMLWTPAQRELCARADRRLREAGGTRIPTRALAALLPAPLDARFAAFDASLRRMPRSALPSAWLAHFEKCLETLGWPGDRVLPSMHFQALESWKLALNTFSAMDRQSGPIGHGQAMQWLREIVASRGFEPRVEHEQPIQVLSLREGAGLPVDEVFILDATDARLPGAPRRYPLLSLETLMAAGVPAVTPATALDDARHLAADLAAHCGALHLSYAETGEFGAKQTPPTIFGALEWETRAVAETSSVERAAAQPRLRWPETDPVPPVSDVAAEGVSGGAKIFRDYAEAPFFAFCKHRLGIKPLEEPSAGIPAWAQGNVVHGVLQEFWSGLRSSAALLALGREEIGARLDVPLDRCFDEALPAERFGPMLRRIERARLRDIILQWLEHEKRRPEAFEVLHCEQKLELEFEGLALLLYVDRVDRVTTRLGARHLVIDYKTGRPQDVGGWKADRLKDPQLPLYATDAARAQLHIPATDGIAFAHVRDGRPALAGATNWGMGLIDRKRTFKVDSWPEQLKAWEEALRRIALGFLAGEAGIGEPAKYRRGLNVELLDLVRERA